MKLKNAKKMMELVATLIDMVFLNKKSPVKVVIIRILKAHAAALNPMKRKMIRCTRA